MALGCHLNNAVNKLWNMIHASWLHLLKRTLNWDWIYYEMNSNLIWVFRNGCLKGERFKVLEGWKGTFQWVNAWYNMPLFSLCCDRLEVVQWIHTAKKENPSCTPAYVILGNLILVYNISFFMLLQFQISKTQLTLTAIRIWNAKIKENLPP